MKLTRMSSGETLVSSCFLLIEAIFLCAMALPSVGAGRPAPDTFGVTHVDGGYFLTKEDFLDEGADQILATGTKVIKLYMAPKRYRWNSQWPKHAQSLVELAQTP